MAIESEQLSNSPLVVPTIEVTQDDDSIEVLTSYARPTVTATIGAGFNNVQLPNGFAYNAGDVVELTVWEADQISSAAISSGIVTLS